MQVNGAVESISSSQQQFHGVNISKSATGVTAYFLDFSLFFDGTTAQIYTQGMKNKKIYDWVILPEDVRQQISDYIISDRVFILT